MIKKTAYILFCLLLFVSFSILGQTRKQLEKQRLKLKSEIENVNELLFKIKKKKTNALDDLKDIDKKIELRERLLKTIGLETKSLTNEIENNRQKKNELDQKLSRLKKNYGSMIFKSYKVNSKQSTLLFLLSSKSFLQAYKRAQYLKQWTSFIEKQGEQIVSQTDLIKRLNDSLLLKKQAKDKLAIVEKKQREKIQIDKNKQQKLISAVKRRERKYRISLSKKQRERRRISEKIDRLIRNAIAKSNKNRKSGAKKSTGFILSPKAKALAIRFEQNKSKLPWPVTKGLVVRRFGKQKHPTLKGITINSTGLHIATQKGAKAHCIFNGKVLGIQLLSEGKKAVLVRHGNYISAYNNLSKVYVKKGDAVVTNQNLGEIFTDRITGKTILIFVIFKNTKRLNPSYWLLKRQFLR